MFRLFTFGRCLSTVLIALLVAGCGETSDTPPEVVTCSAAEPIFLHSKTDDDDGDGLPLDEDFPDINDEDDDIADHTWIRDKSGVYHLFFQNEGLFSGNAIEHYTSNDLQSLDYVGVALRPDPSGWDADALWAPHIVEYGGTYYMFYTGVEGDGPTSRQRLGLATSSDLVTWTRYPVNMCPGTSGDGCIYECDESWTTWGEGPGDFNQQCRDPFVMWDAERQRWVMFATAKSTNGFGTVTVAYSTDLTAWTGSGFVNATRRLADGIGAQTTGGQCENPYVVSHDGTHYLLFTDWRDPEDTLTVVSPRTIVQYATSSTLAADSAGSMNWTYRGHIPDPGVNAIEVQRIDGGIWIMSQSISNPFSGDYERRRQLRLMCVTWEGSFSFRTSNAGFAPNAARGSWNPLAADAAGSRR